MINFKYKGSKVFQNRINKEINSLDDKVFNIVKQEMDIIEAKALRDVPVDSSTLKNTFFRNDNRSANHLKIEQGFTEYYAPYQDFGTGKEFKKSKFKGYLGYIAKFEGIFPARPPIIGKNFLFYPYILGTRMMDRKIATIVKNML